MTTLRFSVRNPLLRETGVEMEHRGSSPQPSRTRESGFPPPLPQAPAFSLLAFTLSQAEGLWAEAVRSLVAAGAFLFAHTARKALPGLRVGAAILLSGFSALAVSTKPGIVRFTAFLVRIGSIGRPPHVRS